MRLTRTSEVAIDREVEGDLFLQDIGQGFGFRPGSFDGAIRYETVFLACPTTALTAWRSISVLQWLLNAETSHPTSSPPHRLTRFFTTLHSALRNPSRAILQFYPTSDDQVQLITSIAQKAGFGGGIVVDYPNSKKARKVFLCLFVGDGGASTAQQQQLPKGLEGENEDSKATFEKRRQRETRREKSGKQKVAKGGKDWILRKKEVRRSPLTVLFLSLSDFRHSYIGDGGRMTFLATLSTRVVKGKQSSRVTTSLFLSLSVNVCFHFSKPSLSTKSHWLPLKQ